MGVFKFGPDKGPMVPLAGVVSTADVAAQLKGCEVLAAEFCEVHRVGVLIVAAGELCVPGQETGSSTVELAGCVSAGSRDLIAGVFGEAAIVAAIKNLMERNALHVVAIERKDPKPGNGGGHVH